MLDFKSPANLPCLCSKGCPTKCFLFSSQAKKEVKTFPKTYHHKDGVKLRLSGQLILKHKAFSAKITGLMNKGNKLKTNLKYREVKQVAEFYTVSAVSLFVWSS